MRTATFTTLKAMIAQDPLTESQKAEISAGDADKLITNDEAAQLLGVSPQTMRRLKVKRVRVNRYLRYKISDVLYYRDSHTCY